MRSALIAGVLALFLFGGCVGKIVSTPIKAVGEAVDIVLP